MFYTFRQNNSGGSFDRDDYVDIYVIIEASSADKANSIAQSIGIYFDGVDKGQDCECCGDRWYSVSENDGTDIPEIYGKSAIDEYSNLIVYYESGTIKHIKTNGRKRKR